MDECDLDALIFIAAGNELWSELKIAPKLARWLDR